MFNRRSSLFLIVALSLIVSIGSAHAQTGSALVRLRAFEEVPSVTDVSSEPAVTAAIDGGEPVFLASDVASPYISLQPGTHTVTYTVNTDGSETTASFDVDLGIGFSTILKHLDEAIADIAPTVVNETSLREQLGLTEADMMAIVPGGFHQDYTAFLDGNPTPVTKLPGDSDPGYTAFGVPANTTSLVIELPEGDEAPLNVPVAYLEGGTIMFRPITGSYVDYTSDKSAMELFEYFNGLPESAFDTTHFLRFADETGFTPQLTQTDRHNFNVWTQSVVDMYPEGTPEYEAIFGDPFKAATTVSDTKTYTMSTAPWLPANLPYVTWANGQPQYVYEGDVATNPFIVLSVQATGGGQVNQVNFLNRPAVRPDATNAQIEPIAIKLVENETPIPNQRLQFNFVYFKN